MKQGFILLEVIIASAIGAILSVMLFGSIAQLGRGTSSIHSMMSMDVRLTLFFRQCVRDISGALVPLVAKKTEKNEKVPKIELVPIDDAFVTGGEKSVREISFVTTNVLPSYGIGKQHIVRVTYRMEFDPEHKNSYRILRSESHDLTYKKSDAKRSGEYILIDGVKEIGLEFVVHVEDKKETKEAIPKQESSTMPKKKKIVVKEWPSRELDDAIKLPNDVIVSLVLWNDRYTRETKVDYVMPIIASASNLEEKGATEKPKTTQSAGKNPTAPRVPAQPETKAVVSAGGSMVASARPRMLNVGPRTKPGRSGHRELVAGMV